MWPFKKKCKHIWKTTKTEELDRTEHWDCVGGMVDVTYFRNQAKYQTCLVCGERRIIKASRID